MTFFTSLRFPLCCLLAFLRVPVLVFADCCRHAIADIAHRKANIT